jgi:ferredoxin-NADP reductase
VLYAKLLCSPRRQHLELTIQRLPYGEVSPYLTNVVEPGDLLQIRGPVGGWSVWRPEQTEPILLVAGGSGVIPLMSMIRVRNASASRVPFRLLYSLRSPTDALYATELRSPRQGLEVTHLYTREAPPEAKRAPGRVAPSDLVSHGWPPDFEPTCYVCGPTALAENASA